MTSSGFEMPPDQKASHTRSIWLRSSPVRISGFPQLVERVPGIGRAGKASPEPEDTAAPSSDFGRVQARPYPPVNARLDHVPVPSLGPLLAPKDGRRSPAARAPVSPARRDDH